MVRALCGDGAPNFSYKMKWCWRDAVVVLRNFPPNDGGAAMVRWSSSFLFLIFLLGLLSLKTQDFSNFFHFFEIFQAYNILTNILTKKKLLPRFFFLVFSTKKLFKALKVHCYIAIQMSLAVLCCVPAIVMDMNYAEIAAGSKIVCSIISISNGSRSWTMA